MRFRELGKTGLKISETGRQNGWNAIMKNKHVLLGEDKKYAGKSKCRI